MIDFLTDTSSLFSSLEYKPIYDHFRKHYNISTPKLFILAASIGFVNQSKQKFENLGSEFKTNYINDNKDKTCVYSIILNDPELGKSIENFEDPEFQKKARSILQQYAQGGMNILINDVFRTNWDGHKLNEAYKEYNVDLMMYIIKLNKRVPF